LNLPYFSQSDWCGTKFLFLLLLPSCPFHSIPTPNKIVFFLHLVCTNIADVVCLYLGIVLSLLLLAGLFNQCKGRGDKSILDRLVCLSACRIMSSTTYICISFSTSTAHFSTPETNFCCH
jgi:hypothetical protein